MKTGKVYLTGAGTGEADLITVKGAKLLKECDVVLYDDLIAESLLDDTKEHCERIFVGKRFGRHSKSQEEINALLAEKAAEGKTVVRLKGGDPFVFGRGGEEILALKKAGVPYGIVPGISSCIAVPELAGIPVTHRKTARSFHVITGHRAADGAELPAEQYKTLAELEGTLVFLMGLYQLEDISAGLLRFGKDPKTPAAVISKGTTAEQRVVRGSLVNLSERVRQAGLETPAVILIGDTAAYDFAPTIPQPLRGIKIGVTGTKTVTRKLSEKLEKLGAAVTEMDYSRVMPYRENPPLEQALAEISHYHWAVFTSPNGVGTFFDFLREHRVDVRSLAGLNFAVIGSGTAAALEKHGIFPAYLPEVYDVGALAEGLVKTVKEGEKVLVLRAEKGSPVLTETLQREKIPFTECKIYDILVGEEKRNAALKKAEEMDFITFASGSGVRGFMENGGRLPVGGRAVCIGTSTAKMLESYGYSERIVAEKFDTDGIVKAVLQEVEK